MTDATVSTGAFVPRAGIVSYGQLSDISVSGDPGVGNNRDRSISYWWPYVRTDIRHPGVANYGSLLQPPVSVPFAADIRERLELLFEIGKQTT